MKHYVVFLLTRPENPNNEPDKHVEGVFDGVPEARHAIEYLLNIHKLQCYRAAYGVVLNQKTCPWEITSGVSDYLAYFITEYDGLKETDRVIQEVYFPKNFFYDTAKPKVQQRVEWLGLKKYQKFLKSENSYGIYLEQV